MVTDEELAAAMVNYPDHTAEQLSELLGEPLRNIEYRMSRPGFAYKIAIIRNSGFADAAVRGASGLGKVYDVLEKEMESVDNFSGERINAAKAYADLAIKSHQIAKQDIELLRLRAFIEENERRRSGVILEVADGESDSGKTSPVAIKGGGTASEGSVRVSVVKAEEIATDANVVNSDAETNMESSLEIAPNVANKILGIVGKFTKDQ